MAIFTILYANFYPPQQDKFYYAVYGNYWHIIIENFPQKFSPCTRKNSIFDMVRWKHKILVWLNRNYFVQFAIFLKEIDTRLQIYRNEKVLSFYVITRRCKKYIRSARWNFMIFLLWLKCIFFSGGVDYKVFNRLYSILQHLVPCSIFFACILVYYVQILTRFYIQNSGHRDPVVFFRSHLGI